MHALKQVFAADPPLAGPTATEAAPERQPAVVVAPPLEDVRPFDPGVRSVVQPRMEFLNEPRFADSRLADDQHQLALALPRPLPAPHQHGDFLVAANKRRQVTLPHTAPAAARPNDPEQRLPVRARP